MIILVVLDLATPFKALQRLEIFLAFWNAVPPSLSRGVVEYEIHPASTKSSLYKTEINIYVLLLKSLYCFPEAHEVLKRTMIDPFVRRVANFWCHVFPGFSKICVRFISTNLELSNKRPNGGSGFFLESVQDEWIPFSQNIDVCIDWESELSVCFYHKST